MGGHGPNGSVSYRKQWCLRNFSYENNSMAPQSPVLDYSPPKSSSGFALTSVTNFCTASRTQIQATLNKSLSMCALLYTFANFCSVARSWVGKAVQKLVKDMQLVVEYACGKRRKYGPHQLEQERIQQAMADIRETEGQLPPSINFRLQKIQDKFISSAPCALVFMRLLPPPPKKVSNCLPLTAGETTL